MTGTNAVLWVTTLSVFFAAVLWLRICTRSLRVPYPPGPKGLPLIGSVLDMNLNEPHLTYTEWGKKYGEIVHTRVFGQDFIIVNSQNTARLLADQRSAIYSGRPQTPLYKLFGIDLMTALMDYGEEWRMHRKLYHLTLRSDAADKYQELYTKKAHILVKNLQRDADSARLDKHLQLYAASLVLEVTYGEKLDDLNDQFVVMVRELADVLVEQVTPARVGLLSALPILNYLPSWMPGFGFMATASDCRKLVKGVSEKPFLVAKNKMGSGALQRCIISDFLANERAAESTAKQAATGVYLAGAETTTSTLQTLILAMLLHPDVQTKVQVEMDTVLGKGVVPTLQDRPRLPYLQAVVYETMRWNPVIPLGLPHAATTDDNYNGYFIPKGSIVIFNAWAMSRDCPDPSRFDPGRHMTPDGQLSPEAKQTNSVFFGFGRRVCPGRFFADNAVWTAAAIMLYTLQFDKAKDAYGNDIAVEPVFTQGVAVHPAPFRFSIRSRSVRE